MSWDAHVNKLVAGGGVFAAAILRPDGKVYAQSPDMGLAERPIRVSSEESGEAVLVNEMKGVAEAMANPDKARKGLWINGVKYHLLSLDPERSVGYYKCLRGGAAVAKTAKTIIVGLWSEEKAQSGGRCNVVVEKLADDFRKIKY